jgi:hypothetical protein
MRPRLIPSPPGLWAAFMIIAVTIPARSAVEMMERLMPPVTIVTIMARDNSPSSGS